MNLNENFKITFAHAGKITKVINRPLCMVCLAIASEYTREPVTTMCVEDERGIIFIGAITPNVCCSWRGHGSIPVKHYSEADVLHRLGVRA